MITCALVSCFVGYRPFLEPLPLDAWWPWLLLPPVVAVAAVYKAIKLDDLAPLRREVARMSVQVLAFVVLAAAFLWALTELV